MQVKQSAIALILKCSIPTSFRELKSFHGVCALSVVSLCYQQVTNLSPRVDLFVGDPNVVSKGVPTLESYSIVPYHSSSDTSLFPSKFSEVFKADFACFF